MKKNITLLYGFSFFDQFMIVIALWVPYLATKGIGVRQFMELQAVFALVILCGELPSGVLSDLWGRKKILLLGSTLKAVSFSLLPMWSSYEGFLFYPTRPAAPGVRGAAEALPSRAPLPRGAEPRQELSDDVLGLEILQVARGQAQPLGIDSGIVFAEQR